MKIIPILYHNYEKLRNTGKFMFYMLKYIPNFEYPLLNDVQGDVLLIPHDDNVVPSNT